MAESNGSEESGHETLTQAEAVKRSFEKLGKRAMPAEVVADVKGRFGIDVRGKYVSAIKAEMTGKGGAARKARPARVPTLAVSVEQPSSQARNNGGGPAIMMEDIQAVHELVRRVGAGPLRDLIGLFER